MSRRYFGTDGVRGPYGGPVINDDFARRLGVAAARHFAASAAGAEVLIGRDPRRSGAALTAALAEGLAEAGLAPVNLGVLPTPALARAVRVSGAAFGAVVTASHNPAADNGIKFFGPEGAKLSDAEEEAIERWLDAGTAAPSGRVEAGRISDRGGAVQDYIQAVTSILPSAALRGWTVALDAANGAAAATAPAVFGALGARVAAMGDAPDGANINAGVGSEHPEALRALARRSGAHLGVALDGDGDRCVLVDERGGVLDGDEILTILAVEALRRGRLAANTLVATVQSNLGVDAAVVAAGGRVVRTPVGDRHVAARMLAEGARLGGESSGHIICAEVAATGDGLVAALKVVEVMLATGEPLSALRGVLKKNPQLSRAVDVRQKPELATLPAVHAAIKRAEAELAPRGRVLVRYSGTEPKIRLLVESPDAAMAGTVMASLEAAVRADLGA